MNSARLLIETNAVALRRWIRSLPRQFPPIPGPNGIAILDNLVVQDFVIRRELVTNVTILQYVLHATSVGRSIQTRGLAERNDALSPIQSIYALLTDFNVGLADLTKLYEILSDSPHTTVPYMARCLCCANGAEN
jgi:hypothetical protein